MSEVKVNKISPRTNCGTVQLGDSGDTITIPAGATITNNGTQTGFGRTGTVDWQTGSIKTADFTAANGEGYFVNTTSGAVTVTLPSSPSAGNIVAIADYAGTSGSNAITIARNSSKIEGGTANASLNVNRESKTFVYVDATQGWVVVNSNDESAIPNQFLTATGGTVTCCGDYKIHTFTGPGDFVVTATGATADNNIVSYMVVAGGAGGGDEGGGGGAGGFREYKGPADSYTASPLNGNPCGTAITVTAQTYPITVGGGGAGGSSSRGTNGNNSVFSTITSAGGGGGGSKNPNLSANDGGSGGGQRRDAGTGSGGSGNTPPTTPPQGNNGGGVPGTSAFDGGGGGGATAAGASGGSQSGGNGGAGATTSINGTPTAYAGGGGGGSDETHAGSGGAGGGGAGANPPSTSVGTNGTDNTGGGGGGGGAGVPGVGGAGGSGIVIIRYKFQ